MKWIVVAIGFCAIAFGAWWGWIGWSIVQVERGWSALISGAVIGSAGMLMLGLAAVMARIDSLIQQLKSQPSMPDAVDTSPGRVAPAAPALSKPVQARPAPPLAPKNVPDLDEAVTGEKGLPKPPARKLASAGDAAPARPSIAAAAVGAAAGATAMAATSTIAPSLGLARKQEKLDSEDTGESAQAIATKKSEVPDLAAISKVEPAPELAHVQSNDVRPINETENDKHPIVALDAPDPAAGENDQSVAKADVDLIDVLPPRRALDKEITWPDAPQSAAPKNEEPDQNAGVVPAPADEASEGTVPRARLPRISTSPEPAGQGEPQTAAGAPGITGTAARFAEPEPEAVSDPVADEASAHKPLATSGKTGGDDAWFGELLDDKVSPKPRTPEPRSLARALNDLDAGRGEQVAVSGSPAPPPVRETAAERVLLRSYESQGIRYRLYVDGSIDAEGPNGSMSFASLEQLRAHIEKRRI